MAKGRRAGSRNRGFFYRTGRGWCAKVEGRFIPLEFENGDRMRERNIPLADVKAAYHRVLASPDAPDEANGVTVLDVCTAYLDQVKADGAASTYAARTDTLFDFCFGLPPRFRKREEKPKPSDYIHNGYGRLAVAELKRIHIDRWLQAHPTWKGGKRSRIQAVKRALNYGVECGLIPANPIKGYKTPKQRARVTYFTPEQEEALIAAAKPALAVAIKVCIRTGARPGCEFAKLTARHVKDHGNRMEWVFPPGESKTKILRVIRIIDPEIIALVRERLNRTGPIFRNQSGEPWTLYNLTERFRTAKKRLIRQGMQFDDDAVMYTCRHTYAKRVLQGYWSGKATNIETLARLMGNSPEVCRDHYLQWCEHYSEPLWESA